MICPGCDKGLNEQQLIDTTIKKAMEYVRQEKKSIAIYKEAGEYRLIDPYFAAANGIPITRVVSVYNNAPAL